MRRYHIGYCLILLLFWSPFSTASKVLIVNSYHSLYTWSAECRQGFDEYVDPHHEVDYFEMDTKRIPSAEFAQKALLAMQKVRSLKPDIVVLMDDSALKLLGEAVSQLGIPVVFMGINNNPRFYFTDGVLPQNVTGVIERPLLERSAASIFRLLTPRTKKILLMMDNGLTSGAIIQTSLYGKRAIFRNDYVVDTYLTNSYSDWKAKVKSVSTEEYDALIISNYASLKDDNNEQVPLDTTSQWTSKHSRVPLFAFWKYSVGRGKAIGGLLMRGYDQGKHAALILNESLATGRTPKVTIPSRGEFIYSQSELDRWGLSLPAKLKKRASIVE
jgi:hypothetical protein